MSISSAEASPNLSPAHSPTLSRRLSSRRGSISASDPYGTHAPLNMNPARSSSSRLTIVRVQQSDGEGAAGRNHRRHGSNASISSTSSKGESTRLSFAFSSFTPVNANAGAGGRPASPSSSPRLRPSSPGGFNSQTTHHHRGNASLPQHSKLSPEKLVELAHSSCNPRPSASSGALPPPASAPVSFTPLPDDVYLPFIDRPSEVSTLLSIAPTAKLFALLAQTFPPDARAPAHANPAAGIPTVDSHARKWVFAELENWLKCVPREDIDDAVWVRKARQCILPRSELIWERMKGALGVPPELDHDEEESLLGNYALPRSPINIPRVNLDSTMLDTDVFEPDSPVVGTSSQSVHVSSSPDGSDLELSIEPVVPAAPPPPSAVDPTTGANMTSLQEVREEDEDEGEGGDKKDSLSASLDVQGLRISTSPSQPSHSPALTPMVVGSLGSGRGVSPSPRRLSDSDSMYDALSERGPGHPLFPSSFAHLSMAPTLRARWV